MSQLTIKSVSKRFGGVHALQSVSLSIEPGQVTGLVGPNGSGKTTLLNCIAGTIQPDQGHVEYQGIITSESPQVAYYSGCVRTFQSSRLFPQLSVLENLLLVHDARDIMQSLHISPDQPEQEHVISQVLEKFNLADKKHLLAGELSYGQKKLCELARVLVSGKDVILLDEVFAGLFPKIISEIIVIIRELREQGKMVVLVEHNPRIIRQLCDSVVVLDAGEVLATGTPERVFSLQRVRQAYLGE